MKNFTKHAFTLVELLVVIAILAIISVVAYQNFGGATDKANAGRKVSDISTIETSLQQYKVDNNIYPQVDTYTSAGNMWGYNSSEIATPSNTLTVTMNDAEIQSINSANGGGKVENNTSQQIGAKGTISQDTMGKKYLTKDLYDVEVGDDKEVGANAKLIAKGIGRYVYAVYRKPTGNNWGTNNKGGSYYNLAYTVKKDGTDSYETVIVGDYDEKSCFDNASTCPKSLIGTFSSHLVNKQEQGKASDGTALPNFGSDQANQGIPYAIGNYN